jgi:hypothetical protein
VYRIAVLDVIETDTELPGVGAGPADGVRDSDLERVRGPCAQRGRPESQRIPAAGPQFLVEHYGAVEP